MERELRREIQDWMKRCQKMQSKLDTVDYATTAGGGGYSAHFVTRGRPRSKGASGRQMSPSRAASPTRVSPTRTAVSPSRMLSPTRGTSPSRYSPTRATTWQSNPSRGNASNASPSRGLGRSVSPPRHLIESRANAYLMRECLPDLLGVHASCVTEPMFRK